MNELHAGERENANKRPCSERTDRDRDHRRIEEQDKERILLVKLAECSRELAVGKANGSSPYTCAELYLNTVQLQILQIGLTNRVSE